ncbi:MAG: hypothetical protein JW828_04250 [Sedimentisphaerales bacterium]|nr:hypothetical protein [Sedimentisphaerales bacterium]
MRKVILVMVMLCLGLAGVSLAGKGEMRYEWWAGIGGATVADLVNSPAFPDNPSGSLMVSSMSAPRDWSDNYGARLSGYILPPSTGSYTFYICSDDASALYLSVDGYPENLRPDPICMVTGYVTQSPPFWTEFPEQKSASISLERGKAYYIEALMKEATGSDNLYVGWARPGGGDIEIIGSLYISDIHPQAATNPAPANGEIAVAVDTLLGWDAPADVNEPAYDVYFGTDPNTALLPLLVGGITDASADPGELEKGVTYYWRVAVTETEGGVGLVHKGVPWQFTTIPDTPIITGQPQNVFLKAGETAVFTVVASSATEMSYAWYELSDPETVLGTEATLVLEDVQAEGEYFCVVSNEGGSLPSNPALLQLKRLIAYWPLDGDVNAYEGIGPNGQIFGTGAGDPPSMFSEGMAGQAIGLNLDAEKGEYVIFGAVGINGEMPRTISCWAKNSVPVAQITNWCTIFGFTSPTATNEQSFDFNRRGDQSQYCIHRYGAEWNMHEIDGQWHFLVATFENDTVRWYTDGEFGGEATTNLQTQDLVHMGKRAHSDPLWRGWVDDARIYNYALDAFEVAQLYIDVVPDAVICPEYDPADLNQDCKVNLLDFAELARVWAECGRAPLSECSN